MAYSSQDGTLEKGTALTFGSWTYIADGSGGFISHLDDCQAVEPFSTSQPNNSVAPAAGVGNPPEDPRKEKNLIWSTNIGLTPMCRLLPMITIWI